MAGFVLPMVRVQQEIHYRGLCQLITASPAALWALHQNRLKIRKPNPTVYQRGNFRRSRSARFHLGL